MKSTTVILNTNTVHPLYLIQLEKEISKALALLGYDLNKVELNLRLCVSDRCEVVVNGRYFGVWDHNLKTFVD